MESMNHSPVQRWHLLWYMFANYIKKKQEQKRVREKKKKDDTYSIANYKKNRKREKKKRKKETLLFLLCNIRIHTTSYTVYNHHPVCHSVSKSSTHVFHIQDIIQKCLLFHAGYNQCVFLVSFSVLVLIRPIVHFLRPPIPTWEGI